MAETCHTNINQINNKNQSKTEIKNNMRKENTFNNTNSIGNFIHIHTCVREYKGGDGPLNQ